MSTTLQSSATSAVCQIQGLPRAAAAAPALRGSSKLTHYGINFSSSVVAKTELENYDLSCNLQRPLQTTTRCQAVAALSTTEVNYLTSKLAKEINVGEVSRMLRELGTSDVPEHFIIKNKEKHGVPLTAYDDFADLPVIDLALLSSDPESVVKQLGEAFTEYGFLQVVNHNVPLELLKEHETLAHKFMALTADVKNRADLGKFMGYNGGINREDIGLDQQSWVEAFNVVRDSSFPNMLDTVVDAIWSQGGPPRFKAAFVELENEVVELSRTLHQLTALSLGLSKDTFNNLYDDDWVMTSRWSHYPPNPKPDLVLGAEGHVDSDALTMLYQDHVGGLQVKHGEKWIGVRPLEGAFVVNVGDILQVLSNGKYKSVEHRVVTNSKQARLSIACFIIPNYTVTISTPEELLTKENPRKYRAFSPKEYHQAVQDPNGELKFTRDKISQVLGI